MKVREVLTACAVLLILSGPRPAFAVDGEVSLGGNLGLALPTGLAYGVSVASLFRVSGHERSSWLLGPYLGGFGTIRRNTSGADKETLNSGVLGGVLTYHGGLELELFGGAALGYASKFSSPYRRLDESQGTFLSPSTGPGFDRAFWVVGGQVGVAMLARLGPNVSMGALLSLAAFTEGVGALQVGLTLRYNLPFGHVPSASPPPPPLICDGRTRDDMVEHLEDRFFQQKISEQNYDAALAKIAKGECPYVSSSTKPEVKCLKAAEVQRLLRDIEARQQGDEVERAHQRIDVVERACPE